MSEQQPQSPQQSSKRPDARFPVRIRESISLRRDRWEQFREDYAVGGGIKEGLKQAFYWGGLAAVVGGMVGGVSGGILDGIVYSLNTSPTKPGTPVAPDPIVIPDNPIGDLYILMPLVLAAIGALALGGYVFYRGLMSPAWEGRRMREGRWDYY